MLLLAALFALSPVATPTPDVAALWREAEAADHQQHDYARAIALYDRIVTEFPAARLERAAETRRDYLRRGITGGEEPLRRFETVREQYAVTDRAKSYAEVEAIVREYPGFPLLDDALLWLGDRASDARRWKEARAHYEALLDRFPQSPQRGFALAGIGHAAFESGDYAAAEAAYALVRGTGIPGAEQVSAGEVDRVRPHVRRRHWLFVALGALGVALGLGAATIDPRRIRAAARAAFSRELLYAGPVALLLVLVAPAEARLDLASVGAAGLGMLVLALFWAEAARPALARPAARAAATGVATIAGASVLYVVLYARDVLIAIEKAGGS